MGSKTNSPYPAHPVFIPILYINSTAIQLFSNLSVLSTLKKKKKESSLSVFTALSLICRSHYPALTGALLESPLLSSLIPKPPTPPVRSPRNSHQVVSIRSCSPLAQNTSIFASLLMAFRIVFWLLTIAFESFSALSLGLTSHIPSPLPPCCLHFSHNALLSVAGTFHIHSCLRDFALISPFIWQLPVAGYVVIPMSPKIIFSGYLSKESYVPPPHPVSVCHFLIALIPLCSCSLTSVLSLFLQ